MHIKHLGQFVRAEVVEQRGALTHGFWQRASKADMARVVKGRIEEPKTVQSAAQVETLGGSEETARSEVRLPFLEGVYLLVLLRDSARCDDLFEQSVGDGNITMDMGRLRGVLCDDLNDVVQRSVFGFCGVGED